MKAEASDEAEDRSLDMGAVGNHWMGAFLCADGVTLSDEQKSGQDGHFRMQAAARNLRCELERTMNR